jgi:hypothetical protein
MPVYARNAIQQSSQITEKAVGRQWISISADGFRDEYALNTGFEDRVTHSRMGRNRGKSTPGCAAHAPRQSAFPGRDGIRAITILSDT